MRRRSGRSWFSAVAAAPADPTAEQVELSLDVAAPAPAAEPDPTAGRTAPRLRGDEALNLLDASPDAVIGLDAYARVVFANAVAERTFGEQRGGLVGAGVDDLVPHLARAVTSLRM